MEKNSRITIHDIARELNITASTVSRALQDNPRISIKTRESVRDMAKKLNYQPNIIASSLRKGRGNTIGVCIPRINRHFFSNVISGIETIANNAGYHTLIAQTYEDYYKEVANVNALMNSRVAGIIMSLSAQTKEYSHVSRIVENGVPLVMFDRVYESLEVSTVVLEDFSGAYQATGQLIDAGCKNIAHLSGPTHTNVYRNRKQGYKQALKDHGFKVPGKEMIKNALTREAGYQATQCLMNQSNKPDAIFAAGDFSALGALIWLKEHGFKVPDEVAVVGFANEPFTALIEPALSSVEQHGYNMGKEVARLFLKEIEHSEENNKPQKIILEPELIVRESSVRKGKAFKGKLKIPNSKFKINSKI